MDQKIEFINDHMVAVDFTHLPMEGIVCIPEPIHPIEEDAGRISDDGILVLNTKYKGFELFKSGMLDLVHLSDRKLLRRQNKLFKKAISDMDKLNLSFIEVEISRREKRKVYENESEH